MAISVLAWVLLGGAAWVVVAVVAAVAVGRMIRKRDEQVPPAPPASDTAPALDPDLRPDGRSDRPSTVDDPSFGR
jgi:hypothetical protein